MEAQTGGKVFTMTQLNNAVAIMENKQNSILAVLPRNIIEPDAFWQGVMEVAKNPDLQQCSPVTVASSIYGAAKLGFMPNGPLQHCWILPYRGKAQLLIGYRGFLDLARRSRSIIAPHAEVVYDNEPFDVHYGTNRRIEHQPYYAVGQANPGNVRCAYATWQDSGSVEFHTIPAERIERAKKASQSASSSFSPWKSDPDAMIRKTAIRDAAKLWPMTVELASAVQWDEQAERGAQVIRMDDMPHEPTTPRRRSLKTDSGFVEPEEPTNGDPSEMSDEEKQAIIEQEMAGVE